MAGDGTLDILEEIHALVSDKLQVVSYKWLSRNFSVSSNDAKRLLQEFVNKHGSGLEVVYTLAGWLKNNPQIYHVRLVPGLKLPESRKEFGDSCSIQVYSVQACIPKDSAVLWSVEFVQAEELFDQPSTTDNCLRDNRFCGVSNSFVKRSVDGKPIVVASSKAKAGLGVAVSSKTNTVHPSFPPPQQGGAQKVSPKPGLQFPTAVSTNDKSATDRPDVNAQSSGPQLDKEKSTASHVDKEKSTASHANKKKGPNVKGPPGNGGSLAYLWGRAPAKPNSSSSEIDTSNDNPPATVTSEAQICAHEALDTISSDDDGQDINYKRESSGGSGRKRKFVFDFSEDEEDEPIVSLATPEPPNRQPIISSNLNADLEKKSMKFEEQNAAVKPEIDQEKTTVSNYRSSVKVDLGDSSKTRITGKFSSEKTQDHVPQRFNENKIDNPTNSASTSPKRKKVLKTQIDERGREVTEVVWEEDVGDSSNINKNSATDGTENRFVAANKAGSVGGHVPSNPVGKTGNKKTTKGGGKDTKQGNILSFFKKV